MTTVTITRDRTLIDCPGPCEIIDETNLFRVPDIDSDLAAVAQATIDEADAWDGNNATVQFPPKAHWLSEAVVAEGLTIENGGVLIRPANPVVDKWARMFRGTRGGYMGDKGPTVYRNLILDGNDAQQFYDGTPENSPEHSAMIHAEAHDAATERPVVIIDNVHLLRNRHRFGWWFHGWLDVRMKKITSKNTQGIVAGGYGMILDVDGYKATGTGKHDFGFNVEVLYESQANLRNIDVESGFDIGMAYGSTLKASHVTAGGFISIFLPDSTGEFRDCTFRWTPRSLIRRAKQATFMDKSTFIAVADNYARSELHACRILNDYSTPCETIFGEGTTFKSEAGDHPDVVGIRRPWETLADNHRVAAYGCIFDDSLTYAAAVKGGWWDFARCIFHAPLRLHGWSTAGRWFDVTVRGGTFHNGYARVVGSSSMTQNVLNNIDVRLPQSANRIIVDRHLAAPDGTLWMTFKGFRTIMASEEDGPPKKTTHGLPDDIYERGGRKWRCTRLGFEYANGTIEPAEWTEE